MTFAVGDRYERQRDRATAVVKQIDEIGAVLQLGDGERERIRAIDVPGRWRLYKICPECLGTGKVNEMKLAKGDFAKLLSRPDCPRCGGSGRVYP